MSGLYFKVLSQTHFKYLLLQISLFLYFNPSSMAASKAAEADSNLSSPFGAFRDSSNSFSSFSIFCKQTNVNKKCKQTNVNKYIPLHLLLPIGINTIWHNLFENPIIPFLEIFLLNGSVNVNKCGENIM